jgi:invasion protein IalB
LQLQLPLSLDIPSGVAVRIGNTQPTVLMFQSCSLDGCLIAYELTAAELASLMKGETITASVRDRNGAEVRFDVVVADLAKIYAKIR